MSNRKKGLLLPALVFFLVLPAATGVTQTTNGLNASASVNPEPERGSDGGPQGGGELRDPFVAPWEQVPVVSGGTVPMGEQKKRALVLMGVSSGGRSGFAVIDGEVYFLNQEKNGIKLLEVRRGEVDIIVDGSRKTLGLLSESDKQNALRKD